MNIGTEWAEYWATGVPPAGVVVIGFKNQGATASYWIDGVRFYPGEYVPTEVDGEKAVVGSSNKLTTTWAGIKAQD